MTAALRRLVLPLLAVLLVAFSAWLFWDSSTRSRTQHAGAEAAEAARAAIPAIMSYQPATAEQQLTAAAQERLTAPFLDTYRQLVVTGVAPEAKQKGITASATVPAVAVVSVERGHVVLLAYVDQITTAGTAAPTQTNSRVRVSMDNVGGRWLISGFEQI